MTEYRRQVAAVWKIYYNNSKYNKLAVYIITSEKNQYVSQSLCMMKVHSI